MDSYDGPPTRAPFITSLCQSLLIAVVTCSSLLTIMFTLQDAMSMNSHGLLPLKLNVRPIDLF